MATKRQSQKANTGGEIFISLNKLKKSPKNARKTPHDEAAIEALAASIAAKGMLQNLVVEPEADTDGAATGSYLVTIGEGRRLAQLLRVKRKEIKKTELVRCVLDVANDATEISLSTKTSPAPTCTRRTSSRLSNISRKKKVIAPRISRRGSASPRMWCDSGCGWRRCRQN
jgi:ParB family chromosome partitioning protein